MASNIIVINRGDTYNFNLSVDDSSSDDGLYHLVDGDRLYLGVTLPLHPFETAIIKKVFASEEVYNENPDDFDGYQDEEGNIIARILPEDTVDLYPGVYYYSVKLKQDHTVTEDEEETIYNSVITVIDKTKFVIND